VVEHAVLDLVDVGAQAAAVEVREVGREHEAAPHRDPAAIADPGPHGARRGINVAGGGGPPADEHGEAVLLGGAGVSVAAALELDGAAVELDGDDAEAVELDGEAARGRLEARAQGPKVEGLASADGDVDLGDLEAARA